MVTGAVIVTYNPDEENMLNLVNSISDQVEQIIIVDNASSNIQAIQAVLGSCLKVRYLLLNENTGIGYAQNRGIEYLLQQDYMEAVILFDHDSHPEPGMIANLIADFRKLQAQHQPVAAIGPVFMDPRTNNQYPIPVFSGFSLKKVYPVPGNDQPVETSFLIASGCFIPRATIQAVGLMNEGFFIDYIDIEWSFRVQSRGLKMFTSTIAKMDHQVGDKRLRVLGREISIHSPLRRYYLARNSVLMVKTGYINWRYKVREVIYTVVRVFIFLLFVDQKMVYLRHILRGWYDGLNGKLGKASF